MERCEPCGADLVKDANFCIICGEPVVSQHQVGQEEYFSRERTVIRKAELFFFESGAELPPQDKREYQDRFHKNNVRYINFTVILQHDPPGKDMMIELTHSFYGPDDPERLLTTGKDRFEIRASSVRSNHTLGCGWETPGYWQPGQYIATIASDGKIVTGGTFYIY